MGRCVSLLVGPLVGVSFATVCAEPQGCETAIFQAVFAQERLWIVSNTGALSSIAEGASARVRVDTPGRVFRICVQDGRPAILSRAEPADHRWTVRRLGDAGWIAAATITLEDGDVVEAMVCDATTITIATRRRLITLHEGRETSLALSGRLHRGFVRAVLGTDDAIFIGRYAGEWGGGLDRIDRRTGTVTSIEGRIPAKYCRRPLDPACDPVNGLAPEPWKPGCVVAAIGLAHMSGTGRLVEVCGDTVTEIFHKPYGSAAPFSTLPFYGVARVGETLRAVAADGLYVIDRSGVRQIGPLPAFRELDGIAVSFDTPGAVVLRRDIGPHPPSASHGPMLVAR